MSVIKNIVLTLIVITLFVVGLVHIYLFIQVDGTFATIVTIAGLCLTLLAAMLVLEYDLLTVWTAPFNRWVEENNKCTAPAVHIGHDLFQMGLDLGARLDGLEDMLKDEQEKYARAIRKGAAFKVAKEKEIDMLKEEILFLRGVITNLSNTNKQQKKSLSFYRTLNWADRTHMRLVK